MSELFNMEVRDVGDSRKLYGWLAVPLKVYQGECGNSWNFELMHDASATTCYSVRLAIGQYRSPDDGDWFAFQVYASTLPLLRKIAAFTPA